MAKSKKCNPEYRMTLKCNCVDADSFLLEYDDASEGNLFPILFAKPRTDYVFVRLYTGRAETSQLKLTHYFSVCSSRIDL